MNKILYDRHGQTIRRGDTVKLIDIPLELLLGLTELEQKTLRGEIGKMHLVQNANQYGKLKLEFFDRRGISRSIFIRPSCVSRVPR